MIVRETSPAQRDLAGILERLYQKSPQGADSVARAYGRARDMLAQLPYCGRQLDDEPEVWRLPFRKYPYTIFYRVQPDLDELQVLRVVHAARVKDLGRVPDDV